MREQLLPDPRCPIEDCILKEYTFPAVMNYSTFSPAHPKPKNASTPLSNRSFQKSRIRPFFFGAGLSLFFSMSIIGGESPSQARTLECFKQPFSLLTCVAVNADAAVNFSWTSDPNTVWGSWGVMGGRLSSGPSCVANSDGFECFGRGDDGHLWIREYGTRFGSTGISRLRPWINLGAPLAGESRSSSIVGDPSCVGISSSSNPAACFMNTEDGNFSMKGGNLNLNAPPSSRVYSSWRYLGRPNLISSPACVMRSSSQVLCVGVSSGNRIAYRLFAFPETITTPSGEWQYIEFGTLRYRSYYDPGVGAEASAGDVRNKCNTRISGDVVCVLPNVESPTGSPVILVFTTGAASTLSMDVLNSPEGLTRFNPKECFYQGDLICVGNNSSSTVSSLAAYSFNLSSRRWSSAAVTLAGSADVVDCTQSTTTTGQPVTECIGSVKGFDSYMTRPRPGRPARLVSSSPQPMNVNRFFMGTWMELPPRPGGALFVLCNPNNLPIVPTRVRCLI
jgi:hypothetical protein